MAVGQNLITGYVGLLSLTQAGFFAIGSYATAILSVTYGWNFWMTLPVAAILAGFFGFLIGLPTLRLKGDYLAIATLGFGEIVRNILNNWDKLTNGPMGIQRIPMISIFGMRVSPYAKWGFLILVWVFVVIAYLLFERLARSRIGRALEAIREDEIAASRWHHCTATRCGLRLRCDDPVSRQSPRRCSILSVTRVSSPSWSPYGPFMVCRAWYFQVRSSRCVPDQLSPIFRNWSALECDSTAVQAGALRLDIGRDDDLAATRHSRS